jgi:hypothetical protein
MLMLLSYVRRVLQPNETMVHAASLHWRIYLRAAVFSCFSAGLAVAAISIVGQQPNISLALWIAAAILLLLTLSADCRPLSAARPPSLRSPTIASYTRPACCAGTRSK